MSKSKDNLLLVAVSSLGIVAVAFSWIYRVQIKNKISNVKNTISDAIDYAFSKDVEEGIKELHPKAQPIFRAFLRDVEKMGYKVKLTSGYRTFQEQIALKKQNSSNASAGKSMHNYGMSVDINAVKGNNWLRKSSSKADWEKSGIPQMAKSKYNLRWGADFKGYHDPIHFDLENIYPVNKLYAQAIKQFGSAEKAQGNKVNIT
jgi:hypothetical protein